MKNWKILLQGNWRDSINGEIIEIVDPSTGDVFASVPRGQKADINKAVHSARESYEKHWKKVSALERGRYLLNVSELIKKHSEELAKLESLDTGKPLKQSRNDALIASRYFEYYAGAAEKVHGDTIPFLDGYQAYTLRQPHGVTGHIIPWNYPLQMSARTFSATLAAGNAMVIKPAEEACLTVVRLAELLLESGLPPNVINVVTGFGEEAGAALSESSGIDHLCFTGSPEIGSIVQGALSKNNISCTMELGGKSPQLIFDDADLGFVLPTVIAAIIQNAGQTCSAGSRVLVQENIYDRFIEMLSQKFSKLRVGSSFMDLDLGPVISSIQRDRVLSFIEKAKTDGIECIAKGNIENSVPKDGFYVPPVIYGPVPRENDLANKEIFGPVLSVLTFRDESDAIHLANNTQYGLTAGVWTQDGSRQLRVAKSINCGQVFINNYGAGGGVELPFGGMKKSGFGREKGIEGLLELTTCKTVINYHG